MARGRYRRLAVAMVALASGLIPASVSAFPHIVQKGETIAMIADEVYGRVEYEGLIVTLNHLGGRSSGVLPGMRLELPAVGHHQVVAGETWKELAERYLGHTRRADVLAKVNGDNPWIPPAAGREVIVPYNLRFVASSGDSTQSVAYRFLGRRDKSWMIASYNGLKRARLRQGETLLVPLSDLPLTELGRQQARDAGVLVRAQGAGVARKQQQLADRELPSMLQDVSRGRYVKAVVRGAILLAQGSLSEPQLGQIYRYLTEAYVALGANGLATTACSHWRQYAPGLALDPIDFSPKIIDVCLAAEPSPAASSSAVSPLSAPQKRKP